MPPYGLYSLANTPEELLSGGYRNTANIPFVNLSDFEKNLAVNYDPAFGRLVTDIRYQPAPFTGAMPFQRMFDLSPAYYDGSDFGFQGDIDIPSFGGISGYRDTGGTKPTLFVQPDGSIKSGIETVDKVQGFVEDSDLEASAIPEFAEGELKQSPTGIARLSNFLSNIPTPFNLVRRGLESLSKFTPSAPKYIGSDFFNPATGLNRFDRAAEGYKRTGSVKDLFASSRSGTEFFRKLRERRAAKQKALEDAAKRKRDIQQFTGGGGDDGPQIQDRPATTSQGLTTSQFQAFRN